MKFKADRLQKLYGSKVAVSDISLELHDGKILGLLGPNGAGKSTTIKMLSGQIAPTSGTIQFDGEQHKRLPLSLRGKIGVMPQDVVVWENLTIAENLLYSGTLQRMKRDDIKRMSDYLVSELRLTPELKTQARYLSGGYKRRLNLALSIIHEPSIVFLDEPTPGIDAQSRRFLMDFIDEFGHKSGHSVVLTDHYLDEAEKLSDYVIIVDHGKIIAQGTVPQIKKQYGDASAVYLDFAEEDVADASRMTVLMDELRKTYPQIAHKKHTITFTAHDPITAMKDSMDVLAKHNMRALNMSVKEPSLEDVFLLLTGRDIRE